MTRVNRRSISVAGIIILVGVYVLTCRTFAQDDGSSASGQAGPLLFGLPDLIIASVSATNTAARGATIAFSDVTKNLQYYTPSSFYNYMYICTSSNGLDASCYVTNHIVPVALGPGATYSWSGTIVVPTGTALGTNFLCDVADGMGTIKESNPNNNTNCVMIIITP